MQPNVKLLAHTPNPTRVIALSARLCYTQGMGIEKLNDKLSDETCLKLVKKIISNKHHSCLEHAVFTFGVEGVSRNFSHQTVRHRNTSYEQQSLHYTVAGEDYEMAMPTVISAENKGRWLDLKQKVWELYADCIADGTPKEDARHILPSGIETKLLMTGNVRQWLHYVKIRSCIVNCQEIVVVAHKIKNLLQEIMPVLEPELGPTCHTDNVCFEGDKFCLAPWKLPCLVKGDGRNYTVKTKWDLNVLKANPRSPK